MRNPNKSSGQNSQLVRLWVLAHRHHPLPNTKTQMNLLHILAQVNYEAHDQTNQILSLNGKFEEPNHRFLKPGVRFWSHCMVTGWDMLTSHDLNCLYGDGGAHPNSSRGHFRHFFREK
jgi:hypothetical protein